MAKLVKIGARWHFLTTWSERGLVPRNSDSGKAMMVWNYRESPGVWSTDKARVAAMVAEFGDDETRRDILSLAEKEPDTSAPVLLFDGATYRYYSPYEMKDAARDAGFEFTRDPSPAHWHTQDPDRAVRCYQVAMHYEGFTCPSAIQMVLQAHLEAQQAHIEASRVVGLDVDLPRPPGLDYYPYQKAAVAYAMQRRNVLFGDSMGLGKSIETLGLVNALHIKSVLIVCPATLKLNWARECQKWLMDGQRVGIATSKQIPFATDIVIVNYESLGRRDIPDECLGCKHSRMAHVGIGLFPCQGKGEGMRCPCVQWADPERPEPTLRPGLDREWELLVADECHRVKSPGAQRSKLLFSVRAKRLAFLSGSPIPNRPKELWTLLSHLAPEVFQNEWKFYREFCGASKSNGFSKDGASNLDLLQNKMRASCFPYTVQVECDGGVLPIGRIVENKLSVYVKSYNHLSSRLEWRRVVAFSKRDAPGRLLRIKHASGEFDCTADHPVWTEAGYVRAESLIPGVLLSVLPKEKDSYRARQSDSNKILLSEMCGSPQRVPWDIPAKGKPNQTSETRGRNGEDLRVVQETVSAVAVAGRKCSVGSAKVLRVIVPLNVAPDTTLCSSRVDENAENGSNKTQGPKTAGHIGAAEGKHPVDGNAGKAERGPQKSMGKTQGGWTGTSISSAVSPAVRASVCAVIPGRLGGSDDSVPASNGFISQGRDLFSLRGSDSSTVDDYYRNRRQDPPSQKAATNRSVEREGLAFSRVLSVEVLEQRSGRGHGGGRGANSSVYDIEVEGNHNYFANGILVHNCMIRRTMAEVWPEIPAKRRQILEFPAGALARYVGAEQDAWRRREDMRLELRTRVELSKASDNPEDYKAAVDALKQGMKVAFSEIAKLRHDTAVAKIPLVIQHIENVLESCDKFVVFAHHHDVIEPLAKHFGAKAVAVFGPVKDYERMAMVDRFNTDPKCKLFIGGIFVAGVGISLRAANLAFSELDWTPASMNQCEDRCFGVGRGIEGQSLLVQHLVLEGSLDANMARTLIAKQEIADKVLDRRSSSDPVPLDPAYEYEPEAVVLGEKREAIAPDEVAELPSTHGATPEWIVKTAAKLSGADVALIFAAVRRLAGLCDGAASRDGSGFNRFDVAVGHGLAIRSALSQKEAALALRLCKKYNHSQLGGMLDSLYEKEA